MSSYTIIKTNGTTLTQVTDGTIDQQSTDLTLIGKNYSGYGIYFNDNFVHLLENFANTNQPNFPIAGQLWFDTSENRLKVYDGTSFKVSGGTIVAQSAPSSLTTGDIWLDSLRQQMYFNDGNSTKLAGPIYTAAQGLSGFQVNDILDTNSISHTVIFFYLSQTLLGIFSKDTFTPATAIAGFSGNLSPGFNASTYNGLAFNVLTSKASALVASDGSLKTAANFVTTTGNSSTVGTISIQNTVPLVLGTNANNEIDVSSTLFNIKSNSLNQNFQISLLNGTGVSPAVFANATTQRVGIFTATPTATLDVAGDVVIEGNLTVQGSTLTVNSTTVNVADKVVVLGTTATPTDAYADGGGIQLAGTTTKSFTWAVSNTSWNSTENINLSSGKTYKINGFDVLTGTSLGSVVTSAPGLNSVGTLTSLQVSSLGFNTSTISFTNVAQSNGTIYLAPKGTGSVDVSSATITNLATPVNSTDAANKTYVDTAVKTAPLALYVNVGSQTNTQIGSGVLTAIFPPTDHQNGTIARVAGSDGTNRLYLLLSGAWVFQNNI
jgi:hypothetical protein